MDFDKPRPGFVKGVVVRVFEDGTSFQVKCQLDGQLSGGRGEHLVKVRAWKVWSLEKTLLEPCCSKWRGSGHGSGRAGGRGRSPGLFFRRDVLDILAHYEQYIIRYFGVWTKDCAKGT